ncbi:class I SAM-dependent methyltransferase [Brevibacterium linens]|uniref:class I SAM-dependent methyltransferase n=1 Tax=Brevibacterium linens TaxID=1703 RepID=UPI000FCC880B|nr:class I SAM-dependent methyltransferase [Brevibacterium linens]AZU01654.1 hypothetical protein CXR29_13905 [Brevibacterium linens]
MDAAEFWAVGDYSVVGDLWSQPGEDLADALEPAGADVIDLATGTGVTAIAMADRGARSVTGVDITASLLDEARRRALAAGHDLTFVRSDISSTPLPTASADIVSSTVGLVFADDPQVALAEARRLTRPGGVVALTSWAGGGFFDRIRKALAPYFPEAGTPWHEEPETIRGVVGADAEVEERTFTMAVPSPEGFVDLTQRHSAPIVVGARAIGSRWSEARRALIDVAESGGAWDGEIWRIPVDYHLITIRV